MNVPPQTAGAATGPAQSSLLINGFNYPSPLPDLTDTLQDLIERKLTDLTVTLEDLKERKLPDLTVTLQD